MAEIHVWTALKWYCPLCPKTLTLCSSAGLKILVVLTREVTDHLMTHRLMLQHITIEDVSHVVLKPYQGFLDLENEESWNAARAVVGQVIEA